MKPWRNEHQLEIIIDNTHLTNDCKGTGMFHNHDELMRYILSNKKECIIHYTMFRSLLKMYPKLVNQLLPIILKKTNVEKGTKVSIADYDYKKYILKCFNIRR